MIKCIAVMCSADALISLHLLVNKLHTISAISQKLLSIIPFFICLYMCVC